MIRTSFIHCATPWNSGDDLYPMGYLGSLSQSAWVDVLRIPRCGSPIRFCMRIAFAGVVRRLNLARGQRSRGVVEVVV